MRVLLPLGIDLLCPSSRARWLPASFQLLIFLLYMSWRSTVRKWRSLPVIVLIYEFLRAPRWADCKAFLRWTWCYVTPLLVAGAVTAVYVYGKVYGTGSLTRLDPYRPRYSWYQFVASNAKFLNELFFATGLRLVQGHFGSSGWLFSFMPLPAGPHGSTYGRLGGYSSFADSIPSSDSRRWLSLPYAIRLGNDFCKSCL